MAKNLKKNYIYNLFYQILTLIVPLITAPYLARVFEADGVGTISYAESIVSYFILFASLGVAMHKYIYFFTVNYKIVQLFLLMKVQMVLFS